MAETDTYLKDVRVTESFTRSHIRLENVAKLLHGFGILENLHILQKATPIHHNDITVA